MSLFLLWHHRNRPDTKSQCLSTTKSTWCDSVIDMADLYHSHGLSMQETDSNCANYLQYDASFRKKSETEVQVQDCGTNTQTCVLSDLDAYSVYWIRITATNQDGLMSDSNFIEITTPEKGRDFL